MGVVRKTKKEDWVIKLNNYIPYILSDESLTGLSGFYAAVKYANCQEPT